MFETFLNGPRAQNAFLLKAVFCGAWSITVEDEAPLSIIMVAQGSAVFADAQASYEIGRGDVVLARGPWHYTVANAASTAEDIRILSGQVCVDPHGTILAESMRLGVRTWGNTADESDATILLIGTYERETSVGALLLSGLPPSAVLRDFEPRLATLLAGELTAAPGGQSVVLDRLLDLITVWASRRIVAEQPERSRDDAVDLALRALREHPELPWTVASLGARAGLSRAAFARRFSQHVGEPPLTYLTRWRLALVADLLLETDLTLEGIAHRVGYANAFAVSAAFKRSHGISPASWRAERLAADSRPAARSAV